MILTPSKVDAFCKICNASETSNPLVNFLNSLLASLQSEANFSSDAVILRFKLEIILFLINSKSFAKSVYPAVFKEFIVFSIASLVAKPLAKIAFFKSGGKA